MEVEVEMEVGMILENKYRNKSVPDGIGNRLVKDSSITEPLTIKLNEYGSMEV